MMIKNRISLFVATFLIIGFFFLALPDKSLSVAPPPDTGCCQFTNSCKTETREACANEGGLFELGNACNDVSGNCAPFAILIPTQIPSLNQWGLIAMAGILGIIGLLAIRRKKLTA